jgi:glycosyltransferase involved in cell wall biosynthesis
VALTVLSVAYPLAPVAPDVAGGAEQILLQLDRALVEAGHRSLVIACAGSRTAGRLFPTAPPAGILDDTAKRLGQLRHGRTIQEVLHTYHVDVVHMHGIDFHTYLPPSGVPVLATLHLPLAWYPQEALQPGRPDTRLHCVSTAQHATRPDGVNFLPPIENGVALKCSARRREGSFALYLGRICPEKGVHLAIEAAKRAQWPLLIAGSVFPYEAHLRYFAEEIAPRLNGECRFIGNVGPELKDEILSEARCLLVPSLAEETSSLVAREALAAGTPVIAFRRQALVETIEHNHTGYIVETVDDMAWAIGAARSIDPCACREAANNRFSLSRMIDKYFAVYREFAAARVPHRPAEGAA